MADRQALCVLVGPLSCSSDQWEYSQVHGEATRPQAGQSRLAPGRAKSPHEPQLSGGVFSPHAEYTGASQSHHRTAHTLAKILSPMLQEKAPSRARRAEDSLHEDPERQLRQ
jgi:hypothetical protein